MSLGNVTTASNSGKLICLSKRWYRRDRYLQVATWFHWPRSGGLHLEVYLKWGGTLQDSCSVTRMAHVCVRHPDHPGVTDVPMRKSGIDSRLAVAHCGFHDEFRTVIADAICSGYVRHGRLTFVVSFKTSTLES